MRIARTATRCSLLGGSVDRGDYIDEFGPCSTLGLTINKYCWVFLNYLPDYYPYQSKISLDQIEKPLLNTEIKHDLTKAIMKNEKSPFELSCIIDVPRNSGLASSTAYITSLLKAHNPILKGEELYKRILEKEQDELKMVVGYQDAAFCVFPGLRKFTFSARGNVSRNLFNEELGHLLSQHMLLFYVGGVRSASQVSESYRMTKEHHKDFQRLVGAGEKYLLSLDFNSLGKLVSEGWEVKKSLSPLCSCSHIDDALRTGMENGAFGGKLLGAGAGGVVCFLAPPNTHKKIISMMGHTHIPVLFDGEEHLCSLY